MRVIIAGGTGLIGKPLCDALLGDGHEVVVLSRNPAQIKGMPAGVKLQPWDSRSASGWGHLADGAGALINLAGAGIADGRWSSARKTEILDSRVAAGKAMVEAIEEAKQKPAVLIQSSAVGYYGTRGDEIITEQSSPGGDFLARVCFEWEASTARADELGVRRPIIRTGIVLSNDGGAFPRLVLPFRLFAGGKIGSGRQWYPWIHIEDEVRAILFLLQEEKANGPFNLAGPAPVTNQELAVTIGKVLGRPALLPTPAFALQAAFGEMATVILDGQRAAPRRLQELGFVFKYPTAEEAVRALLG
ncbi:MAG TPA: TIGR01777 family oxidoreductase [Caldilineaceae bacterium]|nr:TIGR01777 family oxidoreductase [Caldilineaceae bacterium]